MSTAEMNGKSGYRGVSLSSTTTNSRGPLTLPSQLGFGSKAKLALTNSLGRLNSTFRLGVSSGFAGVVQNRSTWTGSELTLWIVVLFLGMVCLYSNRIAFPVSVVELAKEGEWNKRTLGLILSSFYWGYLFTQILGGILAEKYGGDFVQLMAAIVWSIAALVLTCVSNVTELVIVLLRFITGLAQGLHYPALVNLIAHRAPENGIGYFLSIVNTGSFVGSTFIGIVGPALLFNHAHSWHYVFLITGLSGIIWAIGLRVLSVHSLQRHRTHYKLSEHTHSGSGQISRSRERLKLDVQPAAMMVSCSGVPWKKLLKQPAIVVLFIAHFCSCNFLHILMSWTPTYFNELFPGKIGLFNVLPWAAMATSSAAGGWLAEWMISHKINPTTVRYLFTSISLGGSAFFLLFVALFGHTPQHHSTLTLLFMMMSFLCAGFSSAGSLVNLADLVSPNYIGTLFSVMNTVGNIPGILGVFLAGCVLHATSSWVLVFVHVSVTNFVGMFVFLAFGSGRKLQVDVD